MTMPGNEPISSTPIRRQSIAPVRPMSQPGNERQRHRVRNVGADDARHWQFGVKQQKRGDAHRTGPDRRNRDQHAKGCAYQHRRAGRAAAVKPPQAAR